MECNAASDKIKSYKDNLVGVFTFRPVRNGCAKKFFIAYRGAITEQQKISVRGKPHLFFKLTNFMPIT